MKLFFVDPVTGDRINDVGSGSEFSIQSLGSVLIAPDVKSSAQDNVDRIDYRFNDTTFSITEAPFALTLGPDESADYKWQTGPLEIEAVAYDNSGTIVDSTLVEVTVFNTQTAADGTTTGASNGGFPIDGGGVTTDSDGTETLGSEFEAESEAASEAESEAEVEAGDGVATSAGAFGAAAAATGANALTYALASGSIATTANGTNVTAAPFVPTGNTTELDGTPSTTDSILQINADSGVSETEAEVEAEAESEIEAEAEAEVGNGSAAAVAGTSISLASVG